MIRLTQNDWRIFRRLQRKHKVSTEFLRYNLENIQKFIWYETWPRIVIKRYAIRKKQRVFLVYYRLRRVLFDQSNRKLFKRMRQNIRQWSKRMVAYHKCHEGINEYVEEVAYEEKEPLIKTVADKEAQATRTEDLSKQLKEQLELLRNGSRQKQLMNNPKENMNSSLILEKQKQNVEEVQQLDCDTETKKKDHQNENDKEECVEPITTPETDSIDDVRKKLKEQLENIKIQRGKAFEMNTSKTNNLCDTEKQIAEIDSPQTPKEWQINLESTPEKQVTTNENTQPVKQLATDEKTEKSHTEDDNLPNTHQSEKLKTGFNFIDMLMCKVAAGHTTTGTNNATTSNTANKTEKQLKSPSTSTPNKDIQTHTDISLDSTDGFLGFDDCERLPGMLMTPIVPHSTNNNKNSVFVSESLNEYMRLNDLETNYSIDADKSVIKSKIFATNMEGLMTPKTQPPPFDMPVVPENLLKFRTVAERKQYLQKFSKNSRLSIINNEASIYKELQRRMRLQKVKSATQHHAQSNNSSMSFTRNGWYAASFINTEFNKYYYQMLDIDYGAHQVRLRGVRGNNDEFRKPSYASKVIKPSKKCSRDCVDNSIWQDIKPIKSISTKKLNKDPIKSVFKPCPLSHKTFQKPLDDDTAALLLAGGSMAVVRMPTVELEVFPEQGKPLHEIAKRYLQYILPHHDISREWAEFCVSTLQQPNRTLKDVEDAAAKRFNPMDLKKSYTFVIPYLNDRNHILVRRVVDRSEKLDQSFEKSLEDTTELVPTTDFTFRQNLDDTDDELLICADVVSDMINTVAISCSENSFIKTDPDGLCIEIPESKNTLAVAKLEKNTGKPSIASSSSDSILGPIKKPTKQRSLLMELKRLNATIIDAAVNTGKDKKPCSNDYCSMGCICVSLAGELPIREHCGKTKCMLECSCKSSNQSRIMRLETDGRSITTEDAFMLRRKATARLARMEKEFTSTIVLTENETLLINETNNDKKRRCTKAPKRYEDFADTEDEQRKISPKKGSSAALTTIDNENNLADEVKEIREPVYVQDTILEQLKHCTVSLVPLQDMENVAPWCMIHQLYKCFCKGRSIEGKPMIIEKEEVNTTIEHSEGEPQWEMEYNTKAKAKYTFEKVEKRKPSRDYDGDDDEDDNDEDGEDDDDDEKQDFDDNYDNKKEAKNTSVKYKKPKKRSFKETISKTSKSTVLNEAQSVLHTKSDDDVEESIEENDEHIESGRIENLKPKRSLLEVRKRFFQSRPECCRRQIPIPRRMFLYCNRKRRFNVLKFIKTHENEQSRLLLNEHVMRSVYYHKLDTETIKTYPLKRPKEKSQIASSAKTENNTAAVNNKNNAKKGYILDNEVVDLLEEDDDDDQQHKTIASSKILINDLEDNTQLSSSTNKSEKQSFDDPSQIQISNNSGVITVKKFATLSGINMDNLSNTTTTTTTNNDVADANEPLKLPKISSCFSLNVKANLQKPSAIPAEEQKDLDFTSATTVHSAAFSQTSNQQQQLQQQQQSHATQYSIEVAAASSSKDNSSLALDMNNDNVKDVYNNVIKTMNTLVSKKMQDIDFALKRESHIIPAPNADILCIMKWCNFLDAFCEGFAYIWQVKMKDCTYFVVTIRNVMPMIMGALGIVNITALKPDKMPLMGRMLLQKFNNEETQRLAIVMQGKVSHWVIKGFLRSEPTTACNKPTPESHPSLTKKINVLCSLLVKQRQRDEKRKEKEKQNSGIQLNSVAQTSNVKATQSAKIAQIMPTPRVTIPTSPVGKSLLIANSTYQTQNPSQIQNLPPPPSTTPIVIQHPPVINNFVGIQQNSTALPKLPPQPKESLLLNSRKRKSTTDAPISNALSSLKMDLYSKMSTNIAFRKVSQNDINEIHLPEMHRHDHKWLVLDLHNDFSHIFVPEFRDLVSLDRIQKVINFARQKNKIVKLQFFQNAPFDAFVTPKSGRKIYFGPLTMTMNPPTLILLQSVDGQMMLRELYQLQHNIQKPADEKTMAFWLLQLKGHTHFEVDLKVDNKTITQEEILPSSSSSSAKDDKSKTKENCMKQKNTINAGDDDDDDEDCMIIDESVSNVENTTKDPKEFYNFTIESNNSMVGIKPQINSLPGPLPIQALVGTSNEPKERYNFAVKSLKNDTMLDIIPQTNSKPGPLPTQTLKTTMITTAANAAQPAQSLRKLLNTNTIIKPLNTVTAQTLLQMPLVTAKPTTLPILTMPPNTLITGIPTTKPPSIENRTLLPLPTHAVIRDIIPAPPEASYGSTIFISSTSSGTTTSTSNVMAASTVNCNITNNKPLAQIIPEVKMSKPEEPKKNQTLNAASIKRRRISLFCSKKYDQISQNIAVDAVINKILPQNAEDIQINPVTGHIETKMQSNELVSTIGATTITKISETFPNTEINTTNTTAKTPSFSTQEQPPIVFDVNFMDDGDEEPTASIVIKPTTSTTTTQNSIVTTTSKVTDTAGVHNEIKKNSALGKLLTVQNVTNVSNATYKMIQMPYTIATTATSGTSISAKASKNFKLPFKMITKTAVSGTNPSTTAITTVTTTVTTSTPATFGQTKILSKLLTTNSSKLIHKSSTSLPTNTKPRNILPRPSLPPPSSTNTAPTSSRLSLPTTSLQTTASISPMSFASNPKAGVKIQNVTTTKTPAIKSIVTKATNQQQPPATVTIKQVQDMLTKQTIDLTSSTSSPSSNVSIKQVQDKTTIDLTSQQSQTLNNKLMLPSIKATITTTKATATEHATSKTSATSSSNTTSSLISSTSNINMNTSNSTLTISKVQSFGSAPPNKNKDRPDVPASNPSPQPKNVTSKNDSFTNPPNHIHYGYIVSSDHPTQKFVAKRVGKEFYVKVPLVGIVKLQAQAINNYLNKYMSKNFKEPQTGTWNFVAASKDVQIQNHQKSLLVRKAKPPTSANPNKVVKISATDEPILIDD